MKRSLTDLDGRQFDLLVCGGGIYGAWIAYDAALRGLKVIIVDKGDWASATSSASSKLIHGGLRYLQSLNLSLVKKSLNEREMFFKNAPHRVQPLRFGIPAYGSNLIGNLQLGLGLWVYDRLAGISKTASKYGRHHCVGFSKRFPFLKIEALRGGFDYVDGQTDDARFTVEIIDGAQKAGAVCLNYCKVVRYLCDVKGQVDGAELQDEVSGNVINIRSRTAVNAAGQWIDTMTGLRNKLCRLSKGVHLILPDLGSKAALLLFSKIDSRVFFMIPWYGRTLLGTTDNEYEGDIDQVQVETSDIEYLLESANDYLESTVWTKKDVMGSFAGVRVLKDSESASSYLLSRDWELKELENGLFVSLGGKFSSARQDSKAIVDRICKLLTLNENCMTECRVFPWTPDGRFDDWKLEIEQKASKLGVDSESIRWLIFRHGRRVERILKLIESNASLNQRIFPELPLIYADLMHCARSEMVLHLEDLLRRRMPLLILKRMARDELIDITNRVAGILGWDNERVQMELSDVARRWRIH